MEAKHLLSKNKFDDLIKMWYNMGILKTLEIRDPRGLRLRQLPRPY